MVLSYFTRFWKDEFSQTNDLNVRFFRLFQNGKDNYLTRDDFLPLLESVVRNHPGLSFLRNAASFHNHYIQTVIGRIFFHINRRCDDKITLSDLKSSNLINVLSLLDKESDINEIFDYFSYEHFYVIYCKFWELDRNHDFLINSDDLAQYADQSLTTRVINRILDGVPRTLHVPNTNNNNNNSSDNNNKNNKNNEKTNDTQEKVMSYVDFINFIIAEEDKKNGVSIEYWFRVLDLDGDGILSAYELEYFFQEQSNRIKDITNETVQFTDYLCQLYVCFDCMFRSFFMVFSGALFC